MGNHSMTSPASSINESISSNSDGYPNGGHAPFGFPAEGGGDGFFCFLGLPVVDFTKMMDHCHVQSGRMSWFGIKIFILVSALPANAGLMWMLLSRKRAMTASEVLGLNVSIMDVLYCLSLPLDIYTILHESSETAYSVSEALFALNIFGCPLLLTFMCLERYVAAALPLIYVRLGRREYRVVLCACTWILTAGVALVGYFLSIFSIALYLSITISALFLVMLLCLLGIVRVLRQGGPGDGSGANVPLKRQALKNILAVMVPAVVAYSPLVALVPFMVLIVAKDSKNVSSAECHILQFLLAFPNFGLYIGPMFYMSYLRQLSCWRKAGWRGKLARGTSNSKTQAE